MSAFRAAWSGVSVDQRLLADIGGRGYRRRSPLVALMVDPGLAAAFLMRIAVNVRSRISYAVVRRLLIREFSCDISSTAVIEGGVYMPHPVGIVIGAGVEIAHGARIYQNVTLGAGRDRGYPSIGPNVTLFPHCVVVGPVRVGESARVAAGAFVNYDVPARTTAGGERLGGARA